MIAKNLMNRTAKLGAALALALGTAAHAQNSESLRSPGTPNDWTAWSYVDFATSTIAGHANNPTGTFNGVAGLKYKSMQLDLGSSLNHQQCFEVRTGAPEFLPGTTADTRIWITSHLGSNANPVHLSDDIGGGNTFSAARVWLKGAPGSFVNLRVAAFNTNWNTAHFSLTKRLIPNVTEATCVTTNPAMPWVKVINGTMTKSP